ncbi:unnamed protein product, partial [Discosporangium mesarthrocarpum]
TRTIFVQQDDPLSHTKGGVVEAIEESGGSYIAVQTQPPNSYGLNLLDLSFFHPIQRLRDDAGVGTAGELVEATMEAFDVYPRETLECCWHCLFAVYSEVLGGKGDHNLPLPHNDIGQAQAEDALPEHARVEAEKYRFEKAF